LAENHGEGGIFDLVDYVGIGKTASAATMEEFVVSLIGALLGFALTVFIVLLIARMVLDWVQILSSRSDPRTRLSRGPRSQWVGRAHTLAYAGTEPVIAPVRRVLPPMRAGGLSIDLAFTAVFFVALILRSIAYSL
jgi:YggT family protein